VDVKVDRQRLAAAVANLLQNAFKFTRPHGHTSLRTSSTRSLDELSTPKRLLDLEGAQLRASCSDLASEFACDRDAPGRNNERRLDVVRDRPRKDTDAANDDDEARDREHVDECTGQIALMEGRP
jgi:hypothetical protein